MRSVEVLVHLRTSRFDRPLSYAVPDGLEVRVGDVVRVPLANREIYGYVVAAPQERAGERELRAIGARVDGPRAFDETGLALAGWMAATYVCSLGDALGAVVLAGAVPKIEERLELAAPRPAPDRHRDVPARLTRLIWDDLREGFTLGALLRHPEARRAGDRGSLLRALQTLVRSGELKRVRRAGDAALRDRQITILVPGSVAIAGPKAAALVDTVRAAGELPRADAILAGFSSAVIARAVKTGAVHELQRSARSRRTTHAIVRPPFEPTPEQRAAIGRIEALLRRANTEAAMMPRPEAPQELLLYGITGSGKTLVYLHAIAHVVESGGRAIVLVPEISLTPQTARRFEAVFGDRVAVLHSALSQRERYEAWQAAARGDVWVVVGARSAVFAPLENVQLIVIDEAHESSYKQDSTPRYDAVEVARERMRRAGGVLVLGSATPPLGAFARASADEIHLVRLRRRATDAELPVTHVADMAAEFGRGNRRVFSNLLAEGIERRLAAGTKTILFVNRRGSAGFILCRGCGFVPECTRCSTSLAVHRSEGRLRCHFCDWQQPIPKVCSSCGSEAIREFGIGTEKVAEEVTRLWPQARVIRMDSDTTTRIGDHARILSAFEREGDVLVGTQMVAKGLDFPGVTLVGVVAADIGLHVADYRAAERTFDVVTQVCGRSGRAGAGEAIVQTYSPEHPAIAFALAHDYDGFAEVELADRRALRYPPFVEFAYVGVAGRSRKTVESVAQRYAGVLRDAGIGEVLGPAPHPIARLAEEWRWRIGIKASGLDPLRAALRERVLPLARADRTTRLVIAIDP